jgi:hypothetical protein
MVTQRIFERGENRPNGLDTLLQSLQLPLLGIEAAKRSEIVPRRTRAHQSCGSAIDHGRKIMQIGALLV